MVHKHFSIMVRERDRDRQRDRQKDNLEPKKTKSLWGAFAKHKRTPWPQAASTALDSMGVGGEGLWEDRGPDISILWNFPGDLLMSQS